MSLVFNGRSRRQIQHSSKGVANAICDTNVVGSAIPDGQNILLIPDGNDCPANFLANHELFTEHGQNQVFPASGGQAFPQAYNPFAAVPVGLILFRHYFIVNLN